MGKYPIHQCRSIPPPPLPDRHYAPSKDVFRNEHTCGSVPEWNDAVTLLLGKYDTAFPIGTAVLQPNSDTSGDVLKRMIHAILLRNGPGLCCIWSLSARWSSTRNGTSRYIRTESGESSAARNSLRHNPCIYVRMGPSHSCHDPAD